MNKNTLMLRLRFLSYEEAQTPTDHSEAVFNNYWLVHPKKGLVFYSSHKYMCSPQANQNPAITNRINTRYYANLGFEVRMFPIVYIPLHLNGTYNVQGF